MVSTSTSVPSLTLDSALAVIPKRLRLRLIKDYTDLKNAFVERRFDLSGIASGKFCEVALRVLQDRLTGTYIPLGTKIPNFLAECSRLETQPSTAGPESFRILIPRAINFLYTIRNKRGIGHVGGDVDANEIDSATCVRIADWCMSELIRIVHTSSLEEAQALLDTIAERRVPLVWDIGGKKRILSTNLDYKDQVLLLLYSDASAGVPIEDLFDWTEHSRKSNFVGSIILPLHKARLVEYDRGSGFVSISPKGIKMVEEKILPQNPI